MTIRLGLAALAYLVPSFALGFVWHLILFKEHYAALAIYRADIIVPFGFLSMLVQAIAFGFVYERVFFQPTGTVLTRGLSYAADGPCMREWHGGKGAGTRLALDQLAQLD